ncbi:MAG TPA: gluconate 2-dehydrogenase subunit 3 family protein [Thermodesulfobacteriota bacterium]|nr:gluconate 2-dehydrogenase subunit 3 family protein [Thermodesulfobacteriota bacterium]
MPDEPVEERALHAARAVLSRRRFLKVGLAGTAVVVLGGAGLALRRTLLREGPAGGLATLTPQEFSIFAAIADRVCPPGGEGAPGAAALEVARRADRLLATLDEPAQREFKLLLHLVESALVGFLFEGRLRPFTRLPPAEQDRVLASWGGSRLAFRRTGYEAVKRLAGALYYADRRTWARIGYPGPPDVRALRRRPAAAGAADGGAAR